MNQTAIAKDATYNTVGTFIYFFFQWSTTILVVRLADFESAGLFSLAISFCNLFGFISKYGVRSFQVTDIDRTFSDGQYIGHRILTTVISLLPFPILLGYQYSTQPYFMGCVVCYMLFKYLESATDVLFGTMQRAERYDWILRSYLAKGIAPVVAFGVLLWVKAGLLAAILGMTAVYFAVVVLYDLPHLQTVTSLKPSFRGLKPIFVQCFPIMLFSQVTPYMTYLTRSAVEQQFGLTELGYYSSISVVVVVMSTLGGSIWCVLIPKISLAYKKRENQQILRILHGALMGTSAVGALALAAAALVGRLALRIVFGTDILKYTYLLSPVLVSSVLLTVSTLLSNIMIALGKNCMMLINNLLGAVVCTVSVEFLVGLFGMQGATLSLIIAFLVENVLLYLSIRKTIVENEQIVSGNKMSG